MQEIFTLADIAERLKLNEQWLRRFIAKREIPVLRSRKMIRFDRVGLDALEEALRCRSKPQNAPTGRASTASPVRSVSRTGRSNSFAKLRNLATNGSPTRKPPRSKPTCFGVAAPFCSVFVPYVSHRLEQPMRVVSN